MKNKIKNSIFGFTIIEMVMVVFIVGLISVMTLANYRSGQRASGLITETQKIVSVLKRAQNMALTGYEIGGSRVERGYGVNLSSTVYILFADISAAQEYKYDSESEKIQSFNIASGINISSIGCTDIVFKPPLGTVYCDGTILSSDQEKTYTIHEVAENRNLYIRINASGKISINSSL